MDKIFDGNDRAKELNFPDYRAMFVSFAQRNGKRWNGKIDNLQTVSAFVADGRWLVTCPICTEPAYATPADPIHFCAMCGNEYIKGNVARVVFPENREQVEAALLKRKAHAPAGIQKTVALPDDGQQRREWHPGDKLKGGK